MKKKPAERRASRAPSLPQIALVGCGAVSEKYFLPTFSRYPNCAEALVLVDTNLRQAAALGEKFGIRRIVERYDGLPGSVDAAVIATPHHLHAPMSIDFLKAGTHVLVEKPLAMSLAEAERMIAAADESGRILMVNNCRRLFSSYRHVKSILDARELGAVRSIRMEDGSPFEWPSVSGFYTLDSKNARGVLFDRGAHTLDILCYWLGKAPEVVLAEYDSFGGAEALFKLKLSADGVDVNTRFSRLFRLENRYVITCDNGTISGGMFDWSRIELEQGGRREEVLTGQKGMVYEDILRELIDNFVAAASGLGEPVFPASDVAPSIGVIQQAYDKASRFVLPWYE